MHKFHKTMSYILGLALLFAVLITANSCAWLQKESPMSNDPWHLSEPFWNSSTAWSESLLFVQKDEKSLPEANLYFTPTEILSLHNSRGDVTYEEGRDYIVQAGPRSMVLPKGSRIPYKKQDEIYKDNRPDKSLPYSIGDDVVFFAGEGHVFHELQIEVTYRHASDEWKGYKPRFAGEILPKTIGKLRHHQPVTICLCGDSISEGFNASGFAAFAAPVPPFMPRYGDLVGQSLEAAYQTSVTLKNFAIAGRSTMSWQEDAAKTSPEKPDLLIVAYGMNDVMMHDPLLYKMNIENLMKTIREANPRVEFLLVASMIGNGKWLTRADMFPPYRDALQSLTGPGVAMADMTAIWTNLLERKKFHDMTGNGLNHPNDFGHRLYAQAILGLLTR